MGYLRGLGILLFSGGLAACSNNPLIGEQGVIRDRSQDYQQAQTLPRLQVPEGLDDGAIQDILRVPDVGKVATGVEQEFKVPRPDFFYAEAGNEVVNLAREGREKLILVDEPRAQVWEKVQGFWQYNDVDVALSDPVLGVMETAWIEGREEAPGFFATLLKRATLQKVEGPYRDKLRVSLSSAEASDRTAIRLQHVRLPETVTAVDWSEDAEDLTYKSELMYELLHYLSKSSGNTSARDLARRQGADNPALLGRDSRGNPVLKLHTDIDTAWTQLQEAMDQAEVDVGSADRSLGKYYITYSTRTAFEKNERMGFWGFLQWLHGDRGDIKMNDGFLADALGIERDAEEPIRYSQKEVPESDPDDLASKEGYKIYLGERVIYVFESNKSNIEENEETGELEHTGRYQVKLNRGSSGVYVSVLTDSAEQAPAAVAEEILWDIKEHIPSG